MNITKSIVTALIFLTSSQLLASLPTHWVCGPYKPNTGNPIFRVDYLEKTEELVIQLDQDWQKSYGLLPKGKYVTPSHPSSSGMSRYIHMDVSRFFPHPSKPTIPAFLTFTLSYTAQAYTTEVYVTYDDPENPYSANLMAEVLCEAY